MAGNNITQNTMSDATGRKILDALEKVTVLPNTRLSVVNNKLCMTFTVGDYVSSKSYDVGDFCLSSCLLKVCIEPTTGTYDANDWENFFNTYDPDENYKVGDIRIYSGVEYVCVEPTTGVFDPTCWREY